MSSKEKNPLIYVKGYSRRTTRDDLKRAFRDFGRVNDVNMKNGFSFVVNF
jgi:hypothetical protein